METIKQVHDHLTNPQLSLLHAPNRVCPSAPMPPSKGTADLNFVLPTFPYFFFRLASFVYMYTNMDMCICNFYIFPYKLTYI